MKFLTPDNVRYDNGPTPHGVGGLKSYVEAEGATDRGPTPHGVGGLKLQRHGYDFVNESSHPSRGGWIEIGRSAIRPARLPPVPPLTGWVD